MNCSRTRLKLMDFQDGKLDTKLTDLVKDHLSGCEQCQDFAHELGHFQDVFINQKKPLSNPFLTDRIMEQIALEPTPVSQYPTLLMPKLASVAAVALLVIAGILGGLELGNRITAGLAAGPTAYSEISSLVNEMDHEPLEQMLLNLNQLNQ